MFDVFGMVSDTASQYLSVTAEELFPFDEAVLDSEHSSGAHLNDRLLIGATEVSLSSTLYSTFYVEQDDLELRPIEFVRRWIVPGVRAISEMFLELTDDLPELIVTRASRQITHTPVHGGGYIDVNGVYLRWLIDYDAQCISDRLFIDVLLGTAKRIGQS